MSEPDEVDAISEVAAVPAPGVRLLADLDSYGDTGWQWSLHPTSVDGLDSTTMRTNREGEGLWARHTTEGGLEEWTQVTGTGQFQLPRHVPTVKAKIRRWHGLGYKWQD